MIHLNNRVALEPNFSKTIESKVVQAKLVNTFVLLRIYWPPPASPLLVTRFEESSANKN